MFSPDLPPCATLLQPRFYVERHGQESVLSRIAKHVLSIENPLALPVRPPLKFAAALLTASLLAAGWFASGLANASAQVDQLAESAAKGDRTAIKTLIELARKKDADAEYALGLMTYEGRGFARNLKQAFALVERAAGRGHAEARNTLGYFFEHGIGTAKNPAQALTWYQRGADAGNARAQSNIGWLHENGIGVTKDPAIAAQWYRKAADQGLAAAQVNLGNLYESGTGVEKDYPTAIALYEKAAASGAVTAVSRIVPARLGAARALEASGDKAGAAAQYIAAAQGDHAEAQFAAGRLLLSPDNPKRNVSEALLWLDRAAFRRHLNATLLLGRVYSEGKEVPANPARAADYFRRAAMLGDTESAFRYADALDRETGDTANAAGKPLIEGDPAPWYRQAAEKNHVESQFRLARLLELRAARERDRDAKQKLFTDAFGWYQKAAENGHRWALLPLGIALENGQGVKAAPADAIALYRRAAEFDDPEALYRLGNLYDRGIGTPASSKTALEYFSRAAALGHKEAEKTIQSLVGLKPLDSLLGDPFKSQR